MTSLLLAALLWATGQAGATPAMTPAADAATQAHVSSSYGKLPLSFEINRGQTDSQVKFLARGQGYGLFLTPREAVLSLRAAQDNTAQAKARKLATEKRAKADKRVRSAVVRMRLAHANSNPELSGLDPMPGTSNYFIGNDPGKWQTEVAHYARVKYAAVYPGIDLVYYGNQRQLEYDFVLAPGADPKRIELVFEGTRRLSLDKQGNLILATAGGELVQHKPVVYQETEGKRTEVEGRYVLRGGNRAGFRVSSYDARRPMVIDPVLSYSTYFGGSGADASYAIAVDASGNAYVTGVTASTNFPTTVGTYDSTYGDGGDAFVTKLNAAGTALVYSTYLGGSGDDEAWSIAVDAGGNVYVTGITASSNFPTTTGAYQPVYRGGDYPFDAFVTKLNAAGSALVYSTYLGGSGGDYGYGIAVDGSGNAYVTGSTGSASSFPTTAGAYQTTSRGGGEAFVTKLNATGTALVYSTYLGDSGNDYGSGIAVDGSGNAYVTGITASSNFPTTAGAYQRVYGGGSYDVFVTKLNATGTALVYSSFLGGSGWDQGYDIALDGSGNAYVTGYTASSNFPTTTGAYQTVYGGGSYDAFVTKLNATGTALVYSTYLGGSGGDGGNSIVVDGSGNAYLSGTTVSSNFPTTADAYQPVNAGGGDAFVTKLNAAGSAFVYSTYLGGTSSDYGPGIAMDGSGNVYVTGYTASSNFPTTAGAYQTVFGGGVNDAFVAKFSGLGTPPQCTLTASPGTITAGGSATLTATCNPAATSYAWTNTNFATTASGGSVSPTVTTIYSVIASNAAGSGNTASATVTVTVTCTYSLPASQSVAASANTGTLNVTSPSGCAWTASSNVDWITITSGSSGSGNGTVAYAVAANPSGGSRTGTLTIAGQTFTVTQAGLAVPSCTLTASPSTITAGQSATLTATCNPAATSYAWTNTNFATTASGGSVSPTVTTIYSVIASNAAGSGNTATATVAVPVTCTYFLSPTSVEASATTGTLNVTSPSGCPWTAISNVDWVTITSGSSGSGNGTVTYVVAANPSGSSRTGTLTVAGQTFTVTQTGLTVTPIPVSLADLTDVIASMPIFPSPPNAFRMDDPLGLEGVSLTSAEAGLTADTVRVSNLVSDDQALYADFGFVASPTIRFNLSNLSTGMGSAIAGSAIPGVDITGTLGFLQGPPLRLQLLPIGVGGAHYAAGFLFDGATGFDLESVTPLSEDAVAVIQGTGGFAAAKTIDDLITEKTHAAAKTIDDLITEKTAVDLSLPSGTDWSSAVLKCATKVIDQLNVGSVGAKALKMMGANGPRIFEDMRYHLLMGHPEDATLVFSEFAWKALADNVESKDELVSVLQTISKNSSYGRALAAGAGTCGVDYKEALKVLLKGMADKAFPIGTCLAGVGWQAGLQARSLLNNVLVKNLYDKWLAYDDSVFEYGSTRGQDGLIGYVASQLPPGKNPSQINDADRANATELLKTTFRNWKTAQTASQNLKPRLLALKSQFQSMMQGDRNDIASSLPAGASEADVFWRYVELLQRSRARLAPFAPQGMSSDELDMYSRQATMALVKGKSQIPWKQFIAEVLQKWDPDKFTAEPKVCTAPVVTGDTYTSTAGQRGDYLWLEATMGNVMNFSTQDGDGWRNKGAIFSAATTGNNMVPLTITVGATGWSYEDYGINVLIKNTSSGVVYLSKNDTLPHAGGSKTYSYTWDSKANPGNLSIDAYIAGGNPESSVRWIKGSIVTIQK